MNGLQQRTTDTRIFSPVFVGFWLYSNFNQATGPITLNCQHIKTPALKRRGLHIDRRAAQNPWRALI